MRCDRWLRGDAVTAGALTNTGCQEKPVHPDWNNTSHERNTETRSASVSYTLSPRALSPQTDQILVDLLDGQLCFTFTQRREDQLMIRPANQTEPIRRSQSDGANQTEPIRREPIKQSQSDGANQTEPTRREPIKQSQSDGANQTARSD